MLSNFCEKSISKGVPVLIDYKFKLAELIQRVHKCRQWKFKNMKSRKFKDLFTDAFPSSPYDAFDDSTNSMNPSAAVAGDSDDKSSSSVDGKYKMILLSLLRYLSIKSLEIVLSKFYKGHDKVECKLDKFNSINTVKQVEAYAKNQKKIFKALMKQF